jgi:hypothetical protein
VSSVDLSNVLHASSDTEWTDGVHPRMDALTFAGIENVNGRPGASIPDLGRTIKNESRASFHHPCIGAEDLVPPTDRRIS